MDGAELTVLTQGCAEACAGCRISSQKVPVGLGSPRCRVRLARTPLKDEGPVDLVTPRHLLVTDFRTSEISGDVLIGTPII